MRTMRFLVLTVALIFSQSSALALETGTTPTTEFAATPPLIISAYQTAGGATGLAAVEVFNSGDKPVDITKWSLELTTKDGTIRPLAVSPTHKGVLLPKEHSVISRGSDTTFSFVSDKQLSPIVTIGLTYQATDIAYKAATAAVKDTSDVAFFRTYTTTGYSMAAQPFAASPGRVFYDDGLYQPPIAPSTIKIVEVYSYASDCSPNDTSVLCGDYIKLANTSDQEIVVDDLVVRTDSSSANRTGSNTFTLAGSIKPHDVLLVAKTDDGARLSITNSGGYIWLEDAWGLTTYTDTMTHYDSATSAQQGFAYALTSAGAWQWTTTPQPLGQNVITDPVIPVAECPEGKYRSPDTGRCRTIEEAVNALSGCDEGYERNAVTNRCRKLPVAATATLTPCGEGQERNPTTNRCRSIATAVAELLPCDEGYERNPDTHRCRKIKEDTIPEAAFPISPMKTSEKDTLGWWAFGAVATLAIGYGIWEWRQEIAGIARRVLGIFVHNK